MEPSRRVAIEKKLKHARDGARRIMNNSEDKLSRTTARNIAITCDDALRLFTATVTVVDVHDGHDVGAQP